MKSIITLIVTTLISMPLWADTLADIKESGKVRLGIANEVPYGYEDEQGQPKGEAPTVAQHVLKQMGVKDVEVVVTEFGSLIPGLKAGRFDVIAAGMYITPKRCKQVLFSNPTYEIGEGLLVPKGNPKDLHGYGDIKKNKDLKIGVMSGAVELGYAKDFGIDRSQIVVLPDYPSGVAALKAGRIDALAGTSLTMARLAQKDDQTELAQPFEPLVIDGKPVSGFGAFGFREGDEKLRDAFNQQLANYIGTEQHIQAVSEYGFGKHTLPGDATAESLCQE